MNQLVKLLQSITDLVKDRMIQRAVTVSDIWHYIQDQLDVAKVVESGRVEEGVSSGYVLDVYIDTDATYALVTKDDGKLYKIPVTVDAENNIITGEAVEVTMEFSPVTGRQLSVKRSADGKSIRWFAAPACIAAVNRSGEIDSTKLFDSFVEYSERTNEYPELDFFHCGEQVALGKADWVARDGVTYCASGLFYDTPIAMAAAKSLETESNYWGLSIAYLPTNKPEIIRAKEGIEIPVYNSGINRFISLLPENTAASICTSIISKEEVKRMNKQVEDALKKLTGDDVELFEQTVAKIDEINRNAENMVTRAADEVTPEADDEFTAKVTAIIESVIAKNAPVIEAVTEPAPVVDRSKSIEDAILALTLQIAELSKSRSAEVQQVLDDLPAKVVRQKIVRPRAAITPQSLGDNNRNVDLSEIATQTLSRMSAGKQQ